MPPDRLGAPASTARRDLLRLLVLAPAAAACAGARPAAAGKEGGARAAASPPPSSAAEDAEAQLRAIRDAPLAADTEPAFVFRALRREGR